MKIVVVLKYAFVMSVLAYGAVAISLAGAPDWSRPLVPEQPGVAPVFWILLALAVVDWVAGFVLGSRAQPPALLQQMASQRPWPTTRFIIAAALIEAGAIFGLVVTVLSKDSRPGLFTAGVSAILLLMTPASDESAGAA